MIRRWMTWASSGMLLLTLITAGLSCKEEEEMAPTKDATQEELAAPETEKAAENGVSQDSIDFEEEEGVQQEAPPYHDY